MLISLIIDVLASLNQELQSAYGSNSKEREKEKLMTYSSTVTLFLVIFNIRE